MPDYRAALAEMQETVRILRGDKNVPYRMVIGTAAYIRLRDILDHGADPGLPNRWGSAPRSLLLLAGLPIVVEEIWPSNLWAILDSDGKAIQAGILNDLPIEETVNA